MQGVARVDVLGCPFDVTLGATQVRDLFLECVLIARHFALRRGETPRHVIERAREQAQLVGGLRRHVDVELARADRLRRAHQLPDRRDQAALQHERAEHGGDQHEAHRRQCAEDLFAQIGDGRSRAHADAHVADRRAWRRRRRLCAGARRPIDRRRRGAEHRCDQLDVALRVDRQIRGERPAGGGQRRTIGNRRQRRALERAGKAAFEQNGPCRVEQRDVRDVARAGETVEQAIHLRAIGGVEAVLRNRDEHRGDGLAAGAQLVVFAGPLPRHVERRRRERGQHDQRDRQYVELGQQAHPHRRQVERRIRIRYERRQVIAQALHRADSAPCPGLRDCATRQSPSVLRSRNPGYAVVTGILPIRCCHSRGAW